MQINQRHLDFLEEAKRAFEDNILRTTWRNKESDLIALRYGVDRDCVRIYELGDEVGFFAQMIKPTDGKELLVSIADNYRIPRVQL